MRRADFVAAGTRRVREVANRELADVGRTADECPYLNSWVAWFSALPTTRLERAVVLYARPASGTAESLLAALEERVREGVRRWKAGEVPELPGGGGGGTAPPPGGAVAQRWSAPGAGGRGFGTADQANSIQARIGPGRPVDSSSRTPVERVLGESVEHARIHTSATAASIAAQESAEALTVGDDVLFASQRFRPGSAIGDAMLAHELAHTVQQRAGAHRSRSYESLERDADAAALAVLTGDTGALQGGGTRRRRGLSLQRCESCNPDAPPPSLLDRLKDESDVITLADELAKASDADVAELGDRAPPSSALAIAVRWERAFRTRSWSDLATLARKARGPALWEPFSERLVELVFAGSLTITVGGDADFQDFMRRTLEELTRYPTGFRLIVELLAVGKQVKLRRGASSQRLPLPGEQDTAGQLAIGEPGAVLPKEQQRRTAGVGSIVEIAPDTTDNMVFPGGSPSAPKVLESDPAVTLGHELIHALHHARGEAIPTTSLGALPLYGTVNPVTGGIESASELYTITGRRTYDMGKGDVTFNVTTDISENDLRAERGLEARLSHEGVPGYEAVSLAKGSTLAAAVGRYRMDDGSAVPDPVRAAVRRAIVRRYPESLWPLQIDVAAAELPTVGHIAMFVLLEERNRALSEQIELLVGP